MYSEIPLRNFTGDYNKKKVTRSTDIHIIFGVLSREIINFIFNDLCFFSILSIKLLLHNFKNNHMHTVSFDN